MDRFEHGIKLCQDLGIPKAEYGEPLALEELGPPQILVESLGVLTSVELDDKVTLHTTEIGNEGWNRGLLAKLGATALTAAKTLPQPTLGIGRIMAKATSVSGQARHDGSVRNWRPLTLAACGESRARGAHFAHETPI